MDKKKFLYSKDVNESKFHTSNPWAFKIYIILQKENTDIESYLPNYDYDKFSNRDWLCNIINTIANKKFCSFISEAMDKWEKMWIMNRGLKVEAIPEIVSIFSYSKNVSVMNGRTHFLIRKGRHHGKKFLQDREMQDAEEEKENISRLTDKIK